MKPDSFNLGDAIKNVSKIRLKGGVVGKVSTLLIVLCLCVTAMVGIANTAWIAAMGILLVVSLCAVFGWRLINFADKNPAAALLEGAEFLVHQQVMHGSKENPSIRIDPKDVVDVLNSPEIIPEEELRKINEPDEMPKRLTKPEKKKNKEQPDG